MSATYEAHEGITVCISDAGYAALADEQARDQQVRTKTAIFCGTGVGLVVSGLLLVICHSHVLGD